MNKKDILLRLHAYIASDWLIDTWKSKDIHGNHLRIKKPLRLRFYNREEKLIKDFIESIKNIFSQQKHIRYSKKRFEVEIRGQIICEHDNRLKSRK